MTNPDDVRDPEREDSSSNPDRRRSQDSDQGGRKRRQMEDDPQHQGAPEPEQPDADPLPPVPDELQIP
jgi:hypothetical protein